MKPKVIFEGKYLRFFAHKGWEFVRRKDCSGIVVIVAMTGERKLILVEQYRMPLDKNVLELPAGLVNDVRERSRETMAQAAKRELLEETGYRAKKMTFLIKGPVSAGMSSQEISFYQASGLRRVHQGGGDETENITVHEVPLKQLRTFLKRMEKKGKLVDPKIYVGAYFLTAQG
jgi:ADP-ribose pyrophosphatase